MENKIILLPCAPGTPKNNVIFCNLFGLCGEWIGYMVAVPVSLNFRLSSRSALIFAMVGSSNL